MEPQLGSVMTERNRKLYIQNQQNITIPPTLVQEPASNYLIYRDQKSEVHGEDQYHPPPSDLVHVPQYQIHPQSRNHMHVDSSRMEQHSDGNPIFQSP